MNLYKLYAQTHPGTYKTLMERWAAPLDLDPNERVTWKDIVPYANTYVAKEDSYVAGQMLAVFDGMGKPRQVKSLAILSVQDLRNSPAVLIGAYSNRWTMELAASLPFFFDQGKTEAIRERDRPGRVWASHFVGPKFNDLTRDFAIVARLVNSSTGQPIIIAAGVEAVLTQKQIITSPVLHFGTGDHTEVGIRRDRWPNGLIQTEFNLKPGQPVLAEQRLKGSCPFLFTWDGKAMRFLKDVAPMSAPLGAHLTATSLEPIEQTEQWFKIDGDQLVPRNGYYDLRLTDEYWETYYIDSYALMVVDHPAGSNRLVRKFGGARNKGAIKRAIMAIAHTLLKIAYQVLKTGTALHRPRRRLLRQP